MEINQRRPLFVLRGTGRVQDELPGLLSLLVFLAITAVLFRSWEFALLVTASLGFHELGHALALAWFRLDYRIYFGVVGAYTWSRLPERAALLHFSNSAIHLAGPLFSLVLALGAFCLHAVWQPDSRHLLVLANFSAQIGFLNLLPLGALTDGGKTLQRMALSSGRRRVRATMLLLSALGLIGPLLVICWQLLRAGGRELPATGAGFLLIGMWLAASLLIELRRGGPPDRAVRLLMRPRQVIFLALVMWDMLAALLLVILATPFWLEPSYVLGSLENITALLTWLARFL